VWRDWAQKAQSSVQRPDLALMMPQVKRPGRGYDRRKPRREKRDKPQSFSGDKRATGQGRAAYVV